MKRIVIKVGTSTLTDGNGPPDREYVQNLAAQIAGQVALGCSVILVSSGAIRAGMDRLRIPGRPRTIPQKQAAAAVGQGLLMQIYAEAFAKHDLAVAQVLLTRDDFRERSRYLNACNTLAALLKFASVPIVNENDTTAVDEIRFGDNDTLGALVASLAGADALLLLSDVEGLYDKNPSQFPDAKLIPVVEKIDKAVEQLAGGAASGVGTGGMRTKIQAAKICVQSGIPMVIAHGREPDVIARALAGECGTRFLPTETAPMSSRKRWIAFGVTPKGTLTVNDGAKRQLVEGGKSLLPAGVTHMTGHFQSGDLVQIVDAAGHAFAQGFVNYDHTSLGQIMGRQTADIAKVFGEKRPDEVVHRDNLVVSTS
jgi:glutamate 5-kinase